MTSSIAAMHVAKRQLDLDDDTYRAMLARIIPGKHSAKEMTEAERQKVLTVFRQKGFRPALPRRPNGRPKLSGKYAGKLQALWIAGYNLGIVRDRDDAALEAFVARQTGIASARWLHYPDDAAKVIEAVKGWIAREAPVGWRQKALSDGERIANAQWILLGGAELPRSREVFVSEVQLITGMKIAEVDSTGWMLVMNAFGKRIRAQKASSS